MPYKSQAQQGYFHANRAKLEAQGVNVDEWDAASRGAKLPARAKGKPKKSSRGWASLSDLGSRQAR